MMSKYFQFEEDLKKMILLSGAFHLAVILLFSLKAVFIPSDIPKYEPAIRVDLVALPDKKTSSSSILSKPAPAKEDAPIKETTSSKAKPNTKAVKKTQDQALENLKRSAALDKIKKMTQEESSEAQKETFKGNRVSPGIGPRGLEKVEFNQYIGALDLHVKSHWTLPEWLMKQGYRAEVLIKINKDGQIIEKTFITRSGSSDFDSRVSSTIDESNPFPPPPDKFIDLLEVKGIVFAFPQ